jgi:rhamnose utilization protein RhaD (predicted bifunctional aldolase and dehydrogenase)
MSLQSLVTLSRALGEPWRNYVIIGEGNTSLRHDSDRFWIKASGQMLETVAEDGFVEMLLDPVLQVIERGLTGPAMEEAVRAAMVDHASPLRPSIEVTFHALLLREFGAHCVAHTHPVALNQILCSSRAAEFAAHRIFPDEVVLCGPRSAFVPYLDPGVPLAHGIRASARAYAEEFGEPPKVILLQNHGLIALGKTPSDALRITEMAVKAAAIYAGACALGRPVFLSDADIHHLYQRPDELYRRRQFEAP